MGLFSKLTILASLAIGPLAACQAPVYPVVPSNADAQASSVFKIKTPTGSGTGWVVKNEEGAGSYVITAGHVCAGDDDFTLISRNGVEYHAYKIMESEEPDLCELYSPATVGLPLPLSTVMPKYDEELVVIGAPAGQYGDGSAPIYHVHFTGNSTYAGPVYFGVSGGPVISKDGVVGVIVQGIMPAQIGMFVPVETLRDWLDVKDTEGHVSP